METKEGVVTATLVESDRRFSILPELFGAYFLTGESLVYTQTRKMVPEYKGGYWNFYSLSNGGCFLSPALDCEKVSLTIEGNHFSSQVSPEAAGIIATLFALTILADSVNERAAEYLYEQYHRLLEYARYHPEAHKIRSSID